MFQHILVPLDGSQRAEQALPVAVQLARASGATLTLLQVVNEVYNAPSSGLDASPLPLDLLEQDLAGARKYLESARLRADLSGIVSDTRAILGSPATVIIEVVEAQSIDLLILSSHGYTGLKRWLLGSIAERVARHSPVPVLILRGEERWWQCQRADEPRAIHAFVPVDASTHALDALTPAAQLVSALSAPGQGEVHLTQFIEEPEDIASPLARVLLHHEQRHLTTISQQLDKEWQAEFSPALRPVLNCSVSLYRHVVEDIVRVAERGDENEDEDTSYDFIALTTRRPGGLRRWNMGGTVEQVLHAAHLPILLVPPAEPPDKMPHWHLVPAHSGSREK